MKNVIKLPNAFAKCPRCGAKLDAATEMKSYPPEARPKPGDFSICMYCSFILIYEEGYFLHVATIEELEELKKEDPHLYKVLMFTRQRLEERLIKEAASKN